MATEVKVQRDTKVIFSVDEHVAGRIKDLIGEHVEWHREPWAEELFDALQDNEIDCVVGPLRSFT